MVTWSAQTAFTTGRTNETAVYFASFDPTTIAGPASQIAANALGRADFQPAFDHRPPPTIATSSTAPASRPAARSTPRPRSDRGGIYATPIAAFLGDSHDTFFYSADGRRRWDTGWTRVGVASSVLTQMLSGAQ